jgi:hypothetical protein
MKQKTLFNILFSLTLLQCTEEPEARQGTFIEFDLDNQHIAFLQEDTTRTHCPTPSVAYVNTSFDTDDAYDFAVVKIHKFYDDEVDSIRCSVDYNDMSAYTIRYVKSVSETHYVEYYFHGNVNNLAIEKSQRLLTEFTLTGNFSGKMYFAEPQAKSGPLTEPHGLDSLSLEKGKFRINVPE